MGGLNDRQDAILRISLQIWRIVFIFTIETHTCDRPPVVENGGMQLSRDRGSVTYSCERGYLLQGNATRHCLESGEWSGQLPVCQGKDRASPLQHLGTITS